MLVSRRSIGFTCMERLRIGDVASRSGVTRDAIRFYERSGLLAKPGRTQSHQRIYDVSTLDRIRLVEILRERLGFLEEQIAGLESCRARLVDVLRDVAGARSGGYDKLAHLPDGASPPPFRFGRRHKL